MLLGIGVYEFTIDNKLLLFFFFTQKFCNYWVVGLGDAAG